MVSEVLPLVSVIIPTYNRVQLLPKTVTSVLDQDFGDFEILIIDDGSTDDTEIVIKKLQKVDGRIIYLKLPENRGIGFARDYGLRHARGSLISWADSDDPWLPGKLRMQIDVLTAYPEIDILFANYWNIDHFRGTQTSLFERNKIVMESLSTRQIENDVYIVEKGMEKALLTVTIVSTPTAIYRADTIRKIGGYDVILRSAEDFEFFMRAALLGLTFAYLDHLVIKRNKAETSITAQGVVSSLGKIEALRRCKIWCQETNQDDLLTYITKTQQRTLCNLLLTLGRHDQRSAVLKAYSQNLCGGFSLRTFAVAFVALLGPKIIDLLLGVRAKSFNMKL